MQTNIDIVRDLNGDKIVFIHDIVFKGKRSIDWEEVERYLKQFVGEAYIIEESNDVVYIGNDFPDEYTHSNYTKLLKGANAKAKANAAQALPKLIETATQKSYKENLKQKHIKDAKYGWYRYMAKLGLPVYDNDGEVNQYNIFNIAMIVRHSEDGRMYLYDIMNIKKETSNLFQS